MKYKKIKGLLIDSIDEEITFATKWHINKCRDKEYLRNKIKGYLHRVILSRKLDRELFRSEHVDHINGNTLDNRRRNLRAATVAENLCNKGKPKNNKSGFTGVWYDKVTGKWAAELLMNRKKIWLGRLDNKYAAAAIRNACAATLRGEFHYSEQK